MYPTIAIFAFLAIAISQVSSQTVTFAVIGDWGWGPDSDLSLLSTTDQSKQLNYFLGQRAVAAALGVTCEEKKCAFILNTGNNFNDLGISSDSGVYDTQWFTSFEKVYTSESLYKIKFYGALGSHDYGINSPVSNHSILPQIEYTYFDSNLRWYLPNRYYSVKVPKVKLSIQITVVDSSPLIDEYSTNPASKSYSSDLLYASKPYQRDAVLEHTERKLASAKKSKAWNIVVANHPLVSSTEGAKEPYNTLIKPILASTTPQLYFNGHDNILAQYKDPSLPKTRFFTVGSGGTLNPNHLPASSRFTFAQASHGFALVTLKRYSAKIEFYVVNATDGDTWSYPSIAKTVSFSR